MSSAEVVRTSNRPKTRRALNDLQLSANGKEIAVFQSPHKANQSTFTKQLNDATPLNKKLAKSTKRFSISLPDIASTSAGACDAVVCHDVVSIKSAASTPNKSNRPKSTTNTTSTPSRTNLRKKNISIIFEDREKENPNYLSFTQKVEKSLLCSSQKAAEHANVDTKKTFDCKEVAIQCNRTDEDLLLSDNCEKNNYYWKLLAHQRFDCFKDAESENFELNQALSELDQRNDVLREEIQKYTKLLEQSSQITKAIMESIECEDSDEVDDSGFDGSIV
jgi:hypothetical protein